MEQHTLNAEVRKETGKNENHRMRAKGFIPGVVYSHGKTEAIKVPKKEFSRLFRGHISESVLINLNLSGGANEAKQKVVVKDYQLDPITDEVIHLDFYKVTLTEKLQTTVAVVVVGTSIGEKTGGILEVLERDLNIECLPTELPEKIEIDVTNLNVGDSIRVKDLPAEGSLKFLGDEDRTVVAVIAPKAVQEEAAPVAEGEAEAAAAAGAENKEKTE